MDAGGDDVAAAATAAAAVGASPPNTPSTPIPSVAKSATNSSAELQRTAKSAGARELRHARPPRRVGDEARGEDGAKCG